MDILTSAVLKMHQTAYCYFYYDFIFELMNSMNIKKVFKVLLFISASILVLLTVSLTPGNSGNTNRHLPDNSEIFDSLVTDTGNYPMSYLKMPGYLKSVTDPEFGTKITRISEAAANDIIKPLYSTVQAWNSDESRLVIWKRENKGSGYKFLLLDGETYRTIKELDVNPNDIEQLIWDTKDPEILYYPESGEGDGGTIARFVKYNVETDESEILYDFSTDGYEGYYFGFGSDIQFSSWDSKVFGFSTPGGPKGETSFTFNIETLSYGGKLEGRKAVEGLAPMPAPSGKLFYYGGGIYDFQMKLQRTLDLANPYEHACLGRLPNGHDAYFAVDYDGIPGILTANDMVSGERIPFISTDLGYPYPPSGVHISAVSYKNPDLIAVSVIGDGTGRTLFNNEILLVDTGTGIIGRVCHHRSLARNGELGYWAEPHVSISPGGTKLIFGSDWGTDDRVNTFVVDLTDFPD